MDAHSGVSDSLARHERLLEARFYQSPLAQGMLDLQGRFIAVNDACCALVGMPREELVGSSTTQLHHPSDTSYGSQHATELFAGRREAATWERVFTRGDGAPVPVLVYASLVRDAEGAPEAVVSYIQDLTLLRQAEQNLDRVTSRYEALLGQAADWALLVDNEARLLYISPGAETAFGYRRTDVAGKVGFDFIHPDDRERATDAFAAVLAEPPVPQTVVVRTTTAAGDEVWVEIVITNRLDDPLIHGIVCNGRDVTSRIEAERMLRESEARFRAIAETAQEGILAAESDGRVLFANQKLAEILGRSVDAIYATPVPQLISPEDPSFIADQLRTRGSRGAEVYDIEYPHPDGTARALRISVSPLREGEIVGSLAMVSDLSDIKRVEEELRRRAVHDDLTGLPNRTLLMDRLEQALARQARRPDGGVAVMFVDLDNFKLVNDSWGHAVGDALLQKVADRLRQSIRDEDTVARFGGDEFVIICEGVDETQAGELARRVVASLQDRFDVEGQTMYAGASVGIAVSPPSSAGELLRFADAAMYDAKGRGRGRVQVFDVAHAEQAAERLILGNDLRDALEQNALEMYYQPIVELDTGAVISVEALARWHHPTRGAVPTTQFISIAETAGMGPALDRWALEAAMRDASAWRGRIATPLRISVNVSAANLADPTLERNLMSTLALLDVPKDLLTLEMTESALMESPDRATETIRRLAERGITTAIDDFGTGYSSLAYLSQLPVHTLKIDRSFVAGLADDEDAFAIVAAIIDLARILGVRTVAEGVETTEQLALLKRLGCWAGQGYLWSRPLALDDAIAVVSSRAGERFDVTTDPSRRAPAARKQEPVTTEHGLQQLMRMHRQGASLTTIAAALNAEGFRTPQGMRWHRATVARVIRDIAYPSLVGAGDEAPEA